MKDWLVSHYDALKDFSSPTISLLGLIATIVLALLWQILSSTDSQINFSVTHGWSAFGGPTMRSTLSGWEVELAQWLRSFVDRLGHKARRRMCPLYVMGVIGPGDRKSVQPMAERLAPGDYDQLHHFVAAGVW